LGYGVDIHARACYKNTKEGKIPKRLLSQDQIESLDAASLGWSWNSTKYEEKLAEIEIAVVISHDDTFFL